MRFLISLYVTLMLLSGCAGQDRIKDQSFKDFLNFQDICQEERHLRPEYCDQLWRQYTAAQAKMPPKQEIHNISSVVQNVAAPIPMELQTAVQLNNVQLQQEMHMMDGR